MIQSTCTFCQKPYQIDDSAAGMQIQCPSCGQTITAEAAAPAAPLPPAPAAPVGAPGSGNPGVVWASQGARQDFNPGWKTIMAWVR